MSSPWDAMSAELRKPLKGSGSEVTRARRGVVEFTTWANETKLPSPVSVEDEPVVLARFGETLDVYQGPRGLNLDGQACIEWAKKMMKRSRELAVDGGAELEVEPETNHEESLKKLEAERMARREEEEELNEAADDGELDGEEGEYEEEEAPAPRRPPRPPQQPRIVVQMPKAPPSQRIRGSTREERSSFRSKIPKTQVIAIYKRDEDGRRVHVNDYTSDEIGEMHMSAFIEEFVDPKHGNEPDENGWATTTYIVQERDVNTGNLKGPSAPITIRVNVGNEEQQGRANPLIQSLQTVREAKQVLQEFERPDPRADMFRDAARTAGEKGDFSQMMMLAMMERLFSSRGGESSTDKVLMAVLDELRANRGLPPMGGGPPSMPPMPPPMMYPPMPPMPPPQAPPPSAIDKLMELSLAKLASPGPSLGDQMKDMMTFQQLIGASKNNDAAIVGAINELKRSIESERGSKAGSLEDTVTAFEKVKTLVTTLAPEVGGGGVGGFIKGLLTPDVAKAIAGVVGQGQAAAGAPAAGAPPANGMTGVPGSGVPGAPPAVAAPAPAPAAPAPRDPTKPPNPMPPGITDALKGFRIAQTRPTQVERFIDLIMSMYMSQDPFFVSLLQPALDNLNQADKGVEFLKVPRLTGMKLLIDARPELATPEFVDAVLGAMATRAGASIPATLTATTGQWTLDYTGNVIMLEALGAKKVNETPAPTQPAQTETPPPPEYAELIKNAREAAAAEQPNASVASAASEVLVSNAPAMAPSA